MSLTGRARRLTADALDHGRSRQRWRSFPPRRLKDLTPRAARPPGRVCLTFDDGPDPSITPGILDLLGEHDVRATFFVCGAAAQRHPEIVRRAACEGHAVGGHSWDHRELPGMRGQQLERQLDATHRLVEDLTGTPVRYFRPPNARFDARLLRALDQRVLTLVLASVVGFDWRDVTAEQIAARVTCATRAGDIILLHDAVGSRLHGVEPRRGQSVDREQTLRALPSILTDLRCRGLATTLLPDRPITSAAGRLVRAGLTRFV